MAKRRTKGNGSIRKKGIGWEARFTDPDGNRLSRSFQTKRDAQDWLLDMASDVRRGEYVPLTELSLGAWVDEFTATYKSGVAPATKSYHEDCVNRLQVHAPDILDTPLQQLTQTDLQRAVNALQEVYSPRTVRMTIGFIRSALIKAVALNLIKASPAEGLELPAQVTTNGGKLIPPVNMARIINWCKTPDESQSVQAYKDLILFLARHGCRPGEARAIQVNKIKDGWITIDCALDQKQNLKATKTHKSRRVPIALDCLQMVEQRIKLSKQGWLFESTTGTPLQHRKLAQCIKDVTDDKYSPYDLRHTFCSNAVNAGKNLKGISSITGHSIEVLLKHYVHVNDEVLLDIVESQEPIKDCV